MRQNTEKNATDPKTILVPNTETGHTVSWCRENHMKQLEELKHSLAVLGDPDALAEKLSKAPLGDSLLTDKLHAAGSEEERIRNAFNLGQLYARNETEETLKKMETQFGESQNLVALGRMAGGISHDFNNLLTAIMGYARLAQCHLSPEDEIYDDINEVVNAGERAVELTSQLLAMTRKQPVNTRPININTVIEETTRLLRRTMGTHIEMVCLLGEKLGGVEIDSGQFQQVIMNFALNARDAMPNGGKLIINTTHETLETEKADQLALSSGTYVVISIKDTGYGMEPSVLKHIFDPFFTTKEKGKGSGQGLSTCNQIIAKSNGSIRVRSKKGEGTEIRIYFPSRDSLCAEVIEDGLKQEIPCGSESILIVEDDPSVLHFAKKALTKLGYHVYTAENGEEGLHVFKKHESIQLVLTDIVMPLMNGKELIENLAETGKPFKAMYMSGFCQDVFLHSPQDLTMIPMLKKPYSQSKLGRAVRQILDAQTHSLTCVR